MPIIQHLLVLATPQVAPCASQRCCILCHRFGVYRHGFYFRSPGEGNAGSEPVEIQRMLCQQCHQTFSLLPQFLVRRVRASLPLLLEIAQSRMSWMQLFHQLGVAWNTLQTWKKLGKRLLSLLPVILGTVTTWADLSTHLSRWQYPGLLRRRHPTIP